MVSIKKIETSSAKFQQAELTLTYKHIDENRIIKGRKYFYKIYFLNYSLKFEEILIVSSFKVT